MGPTQHSNKHMMYCPSTSLRKCIALQSEHHVVDMHNYYVITYCRERETHADKGEKCYVTEL
jgi:hypothetical protein